MIYLQETQSSPMNPTLKTVLLVIFFVGMAIVVLSRFYVFFEQLYASKYKRPFFLNLLIVKKELSKKQLRILEKEFSFYNKLTEKEREMFRHRLASFIKSKRFIERDGLAINDDIKTLVGATAVMLTFGFRNYKIDLIDKIIIYPKAYYSNLNETYHKGETNPMLKAVVFSWEDFHHGYHIGDDNLNLGIHEFGHAIHLNAFSSDDISSVIFKEGFGEIIAYLENNPIVRQDLISSKYFRAYAYTNHYEFFAVILENFIETPNEFKQRFPELYRHMRQMLNFRFAGY